MATEIPSFQNHRRALRPLPEKNSKEARLSARLPAIISSNVVPLVGGRARDECHDRFGVAHIKDFVRHAGFDVNEIARLIFQNFPAAVAEFVADLAFDDVEDYFEADVNMGVS